MRPTQYSEDVILCLLREADAGTPIRQVCNNAKISTRTFYRWRAHYGGLTLNAARERNDLLHENLRLRGLVEKLRRDNQCLAAAEKEAIPSHDLGGKLASVTSREALSSGRFASVRGQH